VPANKFDRELLEDALYNKYESAGRPLRRGTDDSLRARDVQIRYVLEHTGRLPFCVVIAPSLSSPGISGEGEDEWIDSHRAGTSGRGQGGAA
jgi:hypothetical protein